MKFKEIYPDSYSDHQQSKFEKRCSNHWKLRIENCFKYVDDLRNKTVLDVGCSVGTFTIESALRGAKTCIGIDLDPYALRVANENAKELSVSDRCFFICCNAADLPLESESIDVVFAEDIFEHLLTPVLIKTLYECRRVLKKDGLLIAHTFPTKYDPLFSNNRLYFKLIMAKFQGADSRNYILDLYDRYYGKPYEDSIKNQIHCNPVDHIELLAMMKQADFTVLSYRTHQLYDFDSHGFLRKLLSHIPETHRHISCKLVKS